MSKQFGDVMQDFNDQYKKGFYGHYPLIFKAKTKPTDRVSLRQSYKFKRVVSTSTEGTESVSYEPANFVILKADSHDKQFSTEAKVSSYLGEYSLGYKPKDYNNGEKSLSLKHLS